MKKCVVCFNCHGKEYIKQLSLSEEFSGTYEVVYINIYNYLPTYIYEKMTDFVKYDRKLLQNADMLIVQNMRTDRGFLNSENIIQIAKNVIKIPHYTFYGYWYDINCEWLKYVDENKINEEFINLLYSEEHHKNEIIENIKVSLDKIKKLDEISDISMFDFISNNYQKEKLFYSEQYPKEIFFNEGAKQILNILKIDNNIQTVLYTAYAVPQNRPIIPKIINVLCLNFSNSLYIGSKINRYNLSDYFITCKKRGKTHLSLNSSKDGRLNRKILDEVILNNRKKA